MESLDAELDVDGGERSLSRGMEGSFLTGAAGLLAPVMSGGFALGAVVQYIASAIGALGLVALSVAVSAPLVGRVARSEA